MEKFQAAVVVDEIGLRIFYVGEADADAALKTLRNAHPSLVGDVRFFEQPGAVADPINLHAGKIVEWHVGHPVRLTALTGEVME